MIDKVFIDQVHHCDELLSSGRTEEAVAAFEALVNNWPGYADAYAYLGYAYLSTDRVEDALRVLKIGVEVDPNHSLLRSNLIAALHASEQYRESIPEIVELLKSNESEVQAQHIQLLKDALSWLEQDSYAVELMLPLISPDQNRDVILGILPYLDRTRSFYASLRAYRALALQSPSDRLVL